MTQPRSVVQPRRVFTLRRPVPPTPASRTLRALIVVTALAVLVVEALNLLSVDEPGFALGVRTGWALLRVIGFLVLLRAVRFGRMVARPFGLILAVTTVFAVARLVEPRSGSPVPAAAVLAGLAVLALLCTAVVVMLFRSPAIAEHLSHRPLRRPVPPWVLTARVAALAYGALLLVPFLIALSTLARPRPSLPVAVYLLALWGGLVLVVTFAGPWGSFFLVLGHRWARIVTGVLSAVLLVAQPLLCLALLGPDGLLRDGVPMILVTLIGLYSLHRSRARPAPGPGGGPGPSPEPSPGHGPGPSPGHGPGHGPASGTAVGGAGRDGGA